MKIREGLVSNSSSSSFVIIGNKMNSLPKKIGDKQIYATSNNIEYGEGECVIKVTQGIADFIQKNDNKFLANNTTFDFYDALIELDDGKVFSSNVTIPKNSKVFSFNRSHGSPEDLDAFKEMFEEMFEDLDLK